MELAQLIDHTLLRPDARPQDIDRLCDEAVAYGFYAVCVPPYYVEQAARRLIQKSVKVATVIGFPLGYDLTTVKTESIKRASDKGADEVDAVINLAALFAGDYNYLANELDSLATMSRLRDLQLKMILETALLPMEDKRRIAQLCHDTEINFLKTSTGFSNAGGATVEDVALLREIVGPNGHVKASGGIRSRATAEAMVKAGADRLGCSAAVDFLK